MLDTQTLDVARRQSALFLRDRHQSTTDDISRTQGTFASHGTSHSTMAQQAITRALRAEVIARALGVWEVYRRLIPIDLLRSADLAPQLKHEVKTALDTSMEDVARHHSRAAALIASNVVPALEDLVKDAIDRTEAAIDEHLLTRGGTAGQPTPPTASLQLIDSRRISELRAIPPGRFDLTRLIGLCEELNLTHSSEAWMAVAALTRAVMDHVPPIFECRTFAEVANNYAGTKSFRESMRHLENSARKVADAHLHVQIRPKEVLPTRTQVHFGNDLDVLLGEIARLLS